MSLVVENGTGLSAAESYISVAGADARMAGLGNTNWSDLTETEKEQALRRATVYMEQAYRADWLGTRLLREQSLSWPRYGAVVDGWAIESTLVPTEVANACADLAFKAAGGDLNEDVTRAIIREKVGPLETEYSAFSPQSVRYRSIDMALAPFLRGGSMNARLVRA
jgi:hypothetical protein